MKNFIWDFDGTVFDSYPHINKAFCLMLKNHDIKYDEEEVMSALKISFDNAYLKYSLTKHQITEFRNYSEQIELQPEIKPYYDTKETLEYISKNGGNNFIYTHRDNESLSYYLKKYNMYNMFLGIVTADDGFLRKPSPDAVSFMIEKYNMDKNNTIMIGDREIDVLSGMNAGVHGGLLVRENKEGITSAKYVFKNLHSVKKLISE